jgi:hypothetical protein
MLFCQLGRDDSLREICNGLGCCLGRLVHVGIARVPCRSTLSYASEHRPGSEGVPKHVRGYLNGVPVRGLKAETMEQQPHHTVEGSLRDAMSAPLEYKSIRRYLAPVGPDNRDFDITTLLDLKTQQSNRVGTAGSAMWPRRWL